MNAGRQDPRPENERRVLSLEEALEPAACPKCGASRVRPVDPRGKNELFLECRNRACGWHGIAPLPTLRRKKIYLDTSTVSNIARAVDKGSPEEWIRLNESLRRGYQLGVLCCPGSSIVEREASLTPLRPKIAEVARGVGDIGLRHETDVVYYQYSRALSDYLDGVSRERSEEEIQRECFERDPDVWTESYGFHIDHNPDSAEVTRIREGKRVLRDVHEDIFKDYELQGLTFDQIREREASADGETQLQLGLRSMQVKAAILAGEIEDPDNYLTSITLFERLVSETKMKRKLPPGEALKKVAEFMRSEVPAGLPVADVSSRLFAGLAMDCRGQTPRKLKPSDSVDVEHISTYAPYMDVMIVDRYFDDLCHRASVNLGDVCGCEMISLARVLPTEFADRIDKLIGESKTARVAERVFEAIKQGGHHAEFAERARSFLESRANEDLE